MSKIFWVNFKGYLGVIIFSFSLFGLDKIHLKKGDVLAMKVEKIDEENVYVTDNLNFLKIPIALINHIEYESAKNVQVNDEEFGEKTSPSLWQISHYNAEQVYLWNKQAQKIVAMPRADLEDKIENIYVGLWGMHFGLSFYTPDVYTREKLSATTGLLLETSHKIEFELLFFSLFFSARFQGANFEKKIENQGLLALSFLPNININLWRSEYFRSYIGYGIGSSFLYAYKNDVKAAEVSAVLENYWGLETFFLPYFSLKIHWGVSLYTQKLEIPWLLNYNFSFSTGYYFF